MLLQRSQRVLETIPVGSLGLIPLKSCEDLGRQVNDYLVKWRHSSDLEHKSNIAFTGYERDSYLIPAHTPRFGSGEAKGTIDDSVRGNDLYLMVDVCNYSLTYKLYRYTNHMSPDDHFQDLKRVIAAIGGKARRLTVIMPYLYESRQHKRSARESLDCSPSSILDVSGTMTGLTLRLCEAIGAIISTLDSGSTIGPPTLREYAVDPELVATSSPSAQ